MLQVSADSAGVAAYQVVISILSVFLIKHSLEHSLLTEHGVTTASILHGRRYSLVRYLPGRVPEAVVAEMTTATTTAKKNPRIKINATETAHVQQLYSINLSLY